MASRRLEDAAPALQRAWLKVCAAHRDTFPDRELIITATYRSVEEQFRLYQQGRREENGRWVVEDWKKTVTDRDGYLKRSLHNERPARALDFAVSIGGKISWAEAHYELAGELAEDEGLIWGGRWKRRKDRPHVELPMDETVEESTEEAPDTLWASLTRRLFG